MTRLSLGTGLLLGCLSASCMPLEDSDAPGRGDAGTRAETTAKTPQVGDNVDGGQVTQVDPLRQDCKQVIVEHPAKWRCSEAQLREASGGGITGGGLQAEPPEQAAAGALAATDCAGLAALRRPALKQQHASALSAARISALSNCLPTRSVRYYDSKGEELSYCPGTGWAAGSSPGGGIVGGGTTGGGGFGGDVDTAGGGAKEYSTTNNQVAGVDEADFVKNDGELVYVLSEDGLRVIDAWPAADTRQVAHIRLAGQPTRLFLHEEKLVVYTRVGAGPGAVPSAAQGCTYGYDCRFEAEPGHTLIQIFDVSVPAAPKQLRRYELSGGYVASRRVGSVVYTVVADRTDPVVPGLTLDLTADDPAALEQEYQSALEDAREKVDALPDADFLPWIEQQKADGTAQGKLATCDGALVAKSASGLSFTSVVSFDMTSPSEPKRTLIATKPGFVYASAGALYMAADGADGADLYGWQHGGADEQSSIHKFALEGLDTRYVSSSLIRGHVLNQFSMDEHQEVLRVATSSGWVPDPNVSSNVTTLAERNGKLSMVGELTDLAPDEDIRSVRFDGPRGYLVTFKKTDPLFVIDLKQPAAPKVLGELKIPGFSTYMHPLDEGHVLAVGFDADDQGSFAYFNGIQLQIFDVTQLSAPRLMHKTVIGTRGSASDALTNHLAFNYFASKGLLALPMTVCDGGGQGAFGDKLSFSGLMVFDVSLDGGIVERGRMPFVSQASAAQVPSCGAWWTQGGSEVKRSIFMDDYAIGISDTRYKVAALATLDTALASLPLVEGATE